jgi:hypothetical protein
VRRRAVAGVDLVANSAIAQRGAAANCRRYLSAGGGELLALGGVDLVEVALAGWERCGLRRRRRLG